jgi:hypothetical protein
VRTTVEAAVASDELGQGPVVGCFGELVDEAGAGGVADPACVFGCGDAGPDEEVGFAGAGVPEQDDGFAGVDPGPGGKGGHGGVVDGTVRGVELVEALVAGKRASTMRRAWRRASRSSTSAVRTSAR